MASSSQTIEGRLLGSQVAIDNSIADTVIQECVAEYGYTAEKLTAAKTLCSNAQQLHQKQKAEYGDQYAATEALNKAWEAANAVYLPFVKVSRVALKAVPGGFQKLGLSGKRKASFSGWLTQANQFYVNGLADANLLEKLANFGITQEKLQAGKQLVEAAEAAYNAQKKEMGEAQQATVERDNVLDDLDDWMSDFIAIARIALTEKPQLLEKLGIVEKS